jgi:hypothetical protein
MKYMVMTFGEAAEMLETQSKEWIRGMIEVMHTFDAELRAAGELVDAQGLVDGREARSVRRVGGASVVTDGPFAEAKESLVGYWIVDVDSAQRVEALFCELADRLDALGGAHDDRDVFEIRRIADGPPEV